MAKLIEKSFKPEGVNLTTEINTPIGEMIIWNTSGKTLLMDVDLAAFSGGIDRYIYKNAVAKKLAIPRTYFVYCDLVDPEHNLANGKRSK